MCHYRLMVARVKICGIRTLDEALAVIDAGADALGFHVELEHSTCPIGGAAVASVIAGLPPFVASVIVATASEPEALIRIMRATGANTLQLQSEVSPDTARAVKSVLPYVKLYAVVHVFGADAIEEAKKFEDAVDAIAGVPGAIGGTTLSLVLSRKRTLRVLAVDGVVPSVRTMADRSYPYSKTFYMVTRKNPSDAVRRFIDFVRSPAGSAILSRYGQASTRQEGMRP